MLISFLVLGICAAATIAAVHFLLVPGIASLCERLRLSEKTEGQIIGYATSVPEFVVVVSSALAGVREAGFWNIASSNIINWVLFLAAVSIFRQWRELKRLAFVDEMSFGVVSVAVPLLLLGLSIEPTVAVCLALMGFFVVYKVVDARLNRRTAPREEAGGEDVVCSPARALGLILGGIVVILAAGRFLGGSASDLITRMSIPSWLVGWILGLMTSLPELISFYEIYALHRGRDTLHLFNDTQEALDALVASNMSNLGVILPVGMILFAVVT
jgi:Ca2+/Na+ antiporter